MADGDSRTQELYPTPEDEKPVEPIRWPERLSQTLLRTENRCPRGAYLYVKTMGQARSHEMDRGTLAHACAERLMVERIQYTGEGDATPMQAKFAYDPSIPTEDQEEALSLQTTALVGEVKRELEAAGRIHVPHEEADIARICTFHIALGLDVLPETVLGIERKLVLDLPCGWEVSVKADLTHTPEPGLVVVDDYKTSIWAPSTSDWDAFQVKVGLLAVRYGFPVDVFPCPLCAAADGEIDSTCSVCAGRGKVEMRGERIGTAGTWTRFRGREIYPRKALWRDGTLHRNERDWTLLEMDEFYSDLNDAGLRINERLESWKWPARKGSWCNECADRAACPLTARQRDFEGAVRDAEHASELWEWALAREKAATDVKEHVKGWAAANGASVRVGDEQWSHATTFTTSVRKKGTKSDWDGLEAAVELAATTGTPFRVSDWIDTKPRTEFKKSKVPVDQRQTEVKVDVGHGDDGAASADDRWGADAPW